MATPLPVVNLKEATFECIYGRGCDGLCCQNGRPPVSPEEAERIDDHLDKFRPLLRPEAQAVLEEEGYLSRRIKMGMPMLRVVKGWCIFFNQGCILHKVGAAEGDKYRYKPILCSLFPLDQDSHGEWHVRQQGYRGEAWELFCLNPKTSHVPAAKSLKEEIKLAARLDEAEKAREARIETARD